MVTALRAIDGDRELGERLRRLMDFEIEQALLGALLARNALVDRVDDVVSPAMFADALHGRVYDAIRVRRRRGEIANCLTLRGEFEHDPALAQASPAGFRYLVRLENAVVAPDSARDYAEIVRDLWRRRELVRAAHDAAAAALDRDQPYEAAWGRLSGDPGLAGDGFTVKRMTDVLAKPAPDIGFLVPGYIPLRTVTLFTAHGGTGKSYLALQLMAAMATGTRWLGLETMPGRSYALFCEDPEAVIHHRQRLVCERLGLAADSLDDMHFSDRAGEACELFGPVEHDPWTVRETALWHRFAANVMRLRPRLLFIDTAADVYSANENARPQVRSFIRLLVGLALKLDAAVLLAAHPSQYGLDSGTGYSGSTGWYNSVRAHLYMHTPKDEGDPDLRVLQSMKGNLGARMPELRLRFDDGAFVALMPASGEVARINRRRLERLLVELVAEGQAAGALWSAHPRAEHRYLVAVFQRRHAEFVKSQVIEAMKDLLARGVLRETAKSDRLGKGLIVDPTYKPDQGDGPPAGAGA